MSEQSGPTEPWGAMKEYIAKQQDASSGNSELLSAAKTGAKWMRWWLEQNECDCEYGHSCGKPEREQELERMEAAIAAAEGR